jgi:hypothetical protein
MVSVIRWGTRKIGLQRHELIHKCNGPVHLNDISGSNLTMDELPDYLRNLLAVTCGGSGRRRLCSEIRREIIVCVDGVSAVNF